MHSLSSYDVQVRCLKLFRSMHLSSMTMVVMSIIAMGILPLVTGLLGLGLHRGSVLRPIIMYATHRRRSNAMAARRIAGTLIMALMVALLATVASAQSGSDVKRTLAGSWIVDVTPAPESGIPPFVNLASFTRDGRIINVSPTEGAAVGEWIKTNSGQFAVTFMGFAKVGADFLLAKIRATLEVHDSGDT